jgi:hypothetical protein
VHTFSILIFTGSERAAQGKKFRRYSMEEVLAPEPALLCTPLSVTFSLSLEFPSACERCE